MAQLKHLANYNECPECGAGITEATYMGTHTNGHQREMVRFRCGKTIEYSPNFKQEFGRGVCTQSEEYEVELERALSVAIDAHVLIKDLSVIPFSVRSGLLNFIERHGRVSSAQAGRE